MLQLNAMTVRGVGSYVRGSRLEIRPLTVLCGVNGSGKSTWFKALRMLKTSHEKGLLPFAFNVDDSDAFDVHFMNYSLYCSGDLSEMEDAEQDEQFGPPACIGLEFSAANDLDLGSRGPWANAAHSPELQFLVNGKCAAGTRFRVRIAHPTSNTDDHILPCIRGMCHHVEIAVNGTALIFQRPHCPAGGNNNPGEYRLYRSSSRFDGLDESMLRDLVAERVKQLIGLFLQGYFHISAVRSLGGDAYATTQSAPDDPRERRSVGEDGRKALQVFYWNSREEARHPQVDADGDLSHRGLEKAVNDGLEKLLDMGLSVEFDEGFFARFTNPHLIGPQVPRQFSSGFHQLMPIIVQLGVMEPGELLSVENPEVHLHPDLQLKTAKFLLDQSRIGRRIVIETHSDLIIRRIMRAILEEEDAVSQAHFSLNFSKLEQRSYPAGSVLVRFGVNNQGRIDWPEGFMDESINESQRLMGILYGRRSNADEEGDE